MRGLLENRRKCKAYDDKIKDLTPRSVKIKVLEMFVGDNGHSPGQGRPTPSITNGKSRMAQGKIQINKILGNCKIRFKLNAGEAVHFPFYFGISESNLRLFFNFFCILEVPCLFAERWATNNNMTKKERFCMDNIYSLFHGL